MNGKIGGAEHGSYIARMLFWKQGVLIILASEKVFLFSPARRAAPARGSAKGTRPFGIPFPPAGGDRCVHRCCHAVPAPPEWWRGGWLTAANLFNREYNYQIGFPNVPSWEKICVSRFYKKKILLILLCENEWFAYYKPSKNLMEEY